MKLHLISDVHCESHRDGGVNFLESLDPSEADALVIAGDFAAVGFQEYALETICERYAPRPVIYVHGNHEHWYRPYGDADATARIVASRQPNLVWLEKGIHTFPSGQRLLGATLWYPEPPSFNWFDFRCIPGLSFRIKQEAEDARKFFEAELAPGDLVVTHMLPSEECVHENWQGANTNPYFVNDLAPLIEARKPLGWMFGHTHEHMNLLIGDTWAVSNPFGYPHERRSRPPYKPLLIEV